MTTPYLPIWRRAFLTVAVALAVTPLAAQTFPSKPVRWVVGFAAGGAADRSVWAAAAKSFVSGAGDHAGNVLEGRGDGRVARHRSGGR